MCFLWIQTSILRHDINYSCLHYVFARVPRNIMAKKELTRYVHDVLSENICIKWKRDLSNKPSIISLRFHFKYKHRYAMWLVTLHFTYLVFALLWAIHFHLLTTANVMDWIGNTPSSYRVQHIKPYTPLNHHFNNRKRGFAVYGAICWDLWN